MEEVTLNIDTNKSFLTSVSDRTHQHRVKMVIPESLELERSDEPQSEMVAQDSVKTISNANKTENELDVLNKDLYHVIDKIINVAKSKNILFELKDNDPPMPEPHTPELPKPLESSQTSDLKLIKDKSGKICQPVEVFRGNQELISLPEVPKRVATNEGSQLVHAYEEFISAIGTGSSEEVPTIASPDPPDSDYLDFIEATKKLKSLRVESFDFDSKIEFNVDRSFDANVPWRLLPIELERKHDRRSYFYGKSGVRRSGTTGSPNRHHDLERKPLQRRQRALSEESTFGEPDDGPVKSMVFHELVDPRLRKYPRHKERRHRKHTDAGSDPRKPKQGVCHTVDLSIPEFRGKKGPGDTISRRLSLDDGLEDEIPFYSRIPFTKSEENSKEQSHSDKNSCTQQDDVLQDAKITTYGDYKRARAQQLQRGQQMRVATEIASPDSPKTKDEESNNGKFTIGNIKYSTYAEYKRARYQNYPGKHQNLHYPESGRSRRSHVSETNRPVEGNSKSKSDTRGHCVGNKDERVTKKVENRSKHAEESKVQKANPCFKETSPRGDERMKRNRKDPENNKMKDSASSKYCRRGEGLISDRLNDPFSPFCPQPTPLSKKFTEASPIKIAPPLRIPGIEKTKEEPVLEFKNKFAKLKIKKASTQQSSISLPKDKIDDALVRSAVHHSEDILTTKRNENIILLDDAEKEIKDNIQQCNVSADSTKMDINPENTETQESTPVSESPKKEMDNISEKSHFEPKPLCEIKNSVFEETGLQEFEPKQEKVTERQQDSDLKSEGTELQLNVDVDKTSDSDPKEKTVLEAQVSEDAKSDSGNKDVGNAVSDFKCPAIDKNMLSEILSKVRARLKINTARIKLVDIFWKEKRASESGIIDPDRLEVLKEEYLAKWKEKEMKKGNFEKNEDVSNEKCESATSQNMDNDDKVNEECLQTKVKKKPLLIDSDSDTENNEINSKIKNLSQDPSQDILANSLESSSNAEGSQIVDVAPPQLIISNLASEDADKLENVEPPQLIISNLASEDTDKLENMAPPQLVISNLASEDADKLENVAPPQLIISNLASEDTDKLENVAPPQLIISNLASEDADNGGFVVKVSSHVSFKEKPNNAEGISSLKDVPEKRMDSNDRVSNLETSDGKKLDGTTVEGAESMKKLDSEEVDASVEILEGDSLEKQDVDKTVQNSKTTDTILKDPDGKNIDLCSVRSEESDSEKNKCVSENINDNPEKDIPITPGDLENQIENDEAHRGVYKEDAVPSEMKPTQNLDESKDKVGDLDVISEKTNPVFASGSVEEIKNSEKKVLNLPSASLASNEGLKDEAKVLTERRKSIENKSEKIKKNRLPSTDECHKKENKEKTSLKKKNSKTKISVPDNESGQKIVDLELEPDNKEDSKKMKRKLSSEEEVKKKKQKYKEKEKNLEKEQIVDEIDNLDKHSDTKKRDSEVFRKSNETFKSKDSMHEDKLAQERIKKQTKQHHKSKHKMLGSDISKMSSKRKHAVSKDLDNKNKTVRDNEKGSTPEIKLHGSKKGKEIKKTTEVYEKPVKKHSVEESSKEDISYCLESDKSINLSESLVEFKDLKMKNISLQDKALKGSKNKEKSLILKKGKGVKKIIKDVENPVKIPHSIEDSEDLEEPKAIEMKTESVQNEKEEGSTDKKKSRSLKKRKQVKKLNEVDENQTKKHHSMEDLSKGNISSCLNSDETSKSKETSSSSEEPKDLEINNKSVQDDKEKESTDKKKKVTKADKNRAKKHIEEFSKESSCLDSDERSNLSESSNASKYVESLSENIKKRKNILESTCSDFDDVLGETTRKRLISDSSGSSEKTKSSKTSSKNIEIKDVKTWNVSLNDENCFSFITFKPCSVVLKDIFWGEKVEKCRLLTEEEVVEAAEKYMKEYNVRVNISETVPKDVEEKRDLVSQPKRGDKKENMCAEEKSNEKEGKFIYKSKKLVKNTGKVGKGKKKKKEDILNEEKKEHDKEEINEENEEEMLPNRKKDRRKGMKKDSDVSSKGKIQNTKENTKKPLEEKEIEEGTLESRRKSDAMEIEKEGWDDLVSHLVSSCNTNISRNFTDHFDSESDFGNEQQLLPENFEIDLSEILDIIERSEDKKYDDDLGLRMAPPVLPDSSLNFPVSFTEKEEFSKGSTLDCEKSSLERKSFDTKLKSVGDNESTSKDSSSKKRKKINKSERKLLKTRTSVSSEDKDKDFPQDPPITPMLPHSVSTFPVLLKRKEEFSKESPLVSSLERKSVDTKSKKSDLSEKESSSSDSNSNKKKKRKVKPKGKLSKGRTSVLSDEKEEFSKDDFTKEFTIECKKSSTETKSKKSDINKKVSTSSDCSSKKWKIKGKPKNKLSKGRTVSSDEEELSKEFTRARKVTSSKRKSSESKSKKSSSDSESDSENSNKNRKKKTELSKSKTSLSSDEFDYEIKLTTTSHKKWCLESSEEDS